MANCYHIVTSLYIKEWITDLYPLLTDGKSLVGMHEEGANYELVHHLVVILTNAHLTLTHLPDHSTMQPRHIEVRSYHITSCHLISSNLTWTGLDWTGSADPNDTHLLTDCSLA